MEDLVDLERTGEIGLLLRGGAKVSLQTSGDCIREGLGSGREGSGISLSEGLLKRSISSSDSVVGDKLAGKED